MPVVIDEMEVVTSGSESEGKGSGKGGGKGGGKMDPQEIERILIKAMERCDRVRAH
jgi:hypothetical protein